jgi:hypothetical protein
MHNNSILLYVANDSSKNNAHCLSWINSGKFICARTQARTHPRTHNTSSSIDCMMQNIRLNMLLILLRNLLILWYLEPRHRINSHHWKLLWHSSVHFETSLPVSLRFTSIISCHFWLDLFSWRLALRFPTERVGTCLVFRHARQPNFPNSFTTRRIMVTLNLSGRPYIIDNSHHRHVCNYWHREMSHAEFLGMLMIHLHTEFDMSSLNGADHSGRAV